MIKTLINSLNNKDMKLSEDEILTCLLVLIPEIITQEKYKKSIYLLVKELHRLNYEKFKLVFHIAEKAYQETDYKIFEYNYLDLKNELRLYI